MTELIYRGKSCAEGSRGVVEVVHNTENDVYGIWMRDDDGDSYLVALSGDSARELAKSILEEAGAHE